MIWILVLMGAVTKALGKRDISLTGIVGRSLQHLGVDSFRNETLHWHPPMRVSDGGISVDLNLPAGIPVSNLHLPTTFLSPSHAQCRVCATDHPHSQTCKTAKGGSAPPGTPCLNGIDVRSEGGACFIDREALDLGWYRGKCFTTSDRNQWGPCDVGCTCCLPLHALGAGNGDHLSENGTGIGLSGWQSVVMGQNEPFGELEHILFSLEKANRQNNLESVEMNPDIFMSAVGSMTFLNILADISPKQLVLFDANPHALKYCEMFIEVIKLSETPEEFISNVFGRSVISFKKEHGSLTAANQEKFLSQPLDTAIRDSLLELLPSSAKQTFLMTWGPLQDEPKYLGDRQLWLSQSLLPCDPESSEDLKLGGYSCSLSGLGVMRSSIGGRIPLPASFRYGQGYLQNKKSFQQMRRALDVPIHVIQGEITSSAPHKAMDVCDETKSTSAAIWSADILTNAMHQKSLPHEKLLEFKRRCGKHSMLWLQAMSDLPWNMVLRVQEVQTDKVATVQLESLSDPPVKDLVLGLSPTTRKQLQNLGCTMPGYTKSLSELIREDPWEETKSLVGYFGRLLPDRPALQRTISGRHAAMPYAGGHCMQTGQTWALKQFSQARCTRILEIGGHSTSLSSSPDFHQLIDNLMLYVNVDTSLDHIHLIGNPYMEAQEVHLPITLSEFVRGMEEHGLASFDCLLMLGACSQVGGCNHKWTGKIEESLQDRKNAFAAAVHNARLVIIESPEFLNFEGTKIAGQILESINYERSKEAIVDCMNDAAATTANSHNEHSDNSGILVRRLEAYQPRSTKVILLQVVLASSLVLVALEVFLWFRLQRLSGRAAAKTARSTKDRKA
eukprot:gnl/MRDRNA2_/MRDRNA2_63960_c0_seq1.p1 gnl/MRDRNA2_/MRDRNA2_63960_c0~~gnl/MRDRNA2_/MRDRNA2_63960_c0_seq1.p1  ORF type:complete len:842 (+),score=129.91 gnl/MRDRNA2_/MRDRNA2_63960_c0_seq1:1-2526(+)